MNEKNWKDFKAGLIVIGCPTLKQAMSFISECIEHGFTWCDSEPLSEDKTFWEDNANRTVYISTKRSGLSYSRRANYSESQIKDYVIPIETISRLKVLQGYTRAELVDELYRREHESS